MLNKLTTIKLTRKEFIIYIFTLLLGVLGITSIIKSIYEVHPSKKQNPNNFGSGAYGV